MGYADGLLTSGERIVHREKQHWWVFVWGAKFTILAVIAALLILLISNGMETTGFVGTLKTVLGWVAAAVFIGGIALLVRSTSSPTVGSSRPRASSTSARPTAPSRRSTTPS